jgi:hypothetical protein
MATQMFVQREEPIKILIKETVALTTTTETLLVTTFRN